jgi:arsenite oxidase small subunit
VAGHGRGHAPLSRGVAAPDGPTDPGRRRLSAWLWRVPVLAALAAAGFGGREAWRVHFNKTAPADPPRFEAREPTIVAPVERFAAPWDAVEFVLAGWPSLAVRLPEAIPGALVLDGVRDGLAEGDGFAVAAFSRVCTHLGCLVDLNRDTEAIAFAFNHRGDTPQLTCACHYSVFDATRAGRVVSGPAVEPLPRVRLRLERSPDTGAHVIVADGTETTA